MENDPIHDEQLGILQDLLGRFLASSEYEGFLIVGNRFVDRFGCTRIANLARIFRTDTQVGRDALAASLSKVSENLGSYAEFAARYPVTIIPPLPAFPLMPIVGIEQIVEVVYRVLDSRATGYIRAAGKLPPRIAPTEPVLRTTPRGHWCAYDKWDTPEETQQALQVLPQWSDCRARATIHSSAIKRLSFVPYSVDPNDSWTKATGFHGYFYEPLTEDHDELDYSGNAAQIGVYGEPRVESLETWDENRRRWKQE